MEKLIFRPIGPSDFSMIDELKNDQFVTKRLGINNNGLIIDVDNQSIGIIKIFEYADFVYEIQLAVLSQFRKKGYGAKVIEAATENLFQNSDLCTKIIAFIENDNASSINIFSKNGFTIDKDLNNLMLESGELKDNIVVYQKLNPYLPPPIKKQK